MTSEATMGELKFEPARTDADRLQLGKAAPKQEFLTQYMNYKFRIVANVWSRVFGWIRALFVLGWFFLWLALLVGGSPFFERFLGDWNWHFLIFEGWSIVYLICVYLPCLIFWISTLFPTKQSAQVRTPEAPSRTDDKIETFSVAGHPKKIQELQARMEQRRKIDQYERADKGSRRGCARSLCTFTKKSTSIRWLSQIGLKN